MNINTQSVRNEIDQLADGAQALIAATADVAGDKIGEARSRLVAVLERGKDIYNRVRDKEIEGAMAVDAAAHEHLYKTLAIATGVGLLIGYFLARGCPCRRE